MLLTRLMPTKLICIRSEWPRIKQIAFLVTLTLLVIMPYVEANWNPYAVLGVQRDASLGQIKRAYRELARKFHPDKSNTSEDDSGRKFIELQKAFNILKDPVRRNRYDQHGDIEENRHSRGYYQSDSRPIRESWTVNTGHGTYNFQSSSRDSYYRKKSITTKQYYNDFVKESKQWPFLIFFYFDLCRSCLKLESKWIRITEEFAKFNIGAFTINVQREIHLAHEHGISSIPQISCLIDGRVRHYYQFELSLQSLTKFIKDSLPNNLIQMLKTEYDQHRFIETSPQKNRLSAIILNNEKTVRLRYLILAFALREYYNFGFVSSKLSEYKTISKRYELDPDSQSYLIVFGEHIDHPLQKFKFDSENFNTSYYSQQLLDWPYLKLPKLSSQKKFDELCLRAKTKRNEQVKLPLCVMLFTSATPSYVPNRDKLIAFIEQNGLSRDKEVVFVYVDPVRQSVFIQFLLAETVANTPIFIKESIQSSIILIRRHHTDSRKAEYKWISFRWDPKSPDVIDKAKLELHQFIQSYKQGSYGFLDKTTIIQLIDEEGPSLMEKMYRRFIDIISLVAFHLTAKEIFSSIMMLITGVILTKLFLHKPHVSVRADTDDDISSSKQKDRQQKSQSKCGNQDIYNNPSNTNDELKLTELKAETYNGMVRLLKPGYRSIILLIDQQTKDKLIVNFRNAVWPYRKNKTLLFGYLCLDKNLFWYKTLLERILDCENLRVNKKNCIGTVLSLNGFKKYLRVYHAKHHEIDYYDDKTNNDASFLGFDEDDSDLEQEIGGKLESEHIIYTTDNLLDKLSIWLDKMFDGLTKRYFLDSWPEEIK